MKTIPMDLSQFIQTLRDHPDFGSACVYHRYLPPQEALFGDDPGLPGELGDLLKQDGITHLFRHQADALQALRKGGNLLVATATASGKSLIYNLSVLEQHLKGKGGKALYLFPLKALEQDQLKGLLHLTKRVQGQKISAHIYDGDTSAYRRKQIRDKIPDILLTNPDMLHRAILPHHEVWEELFRNLSYIVLDEVHTYRGIFGSHMNQVIRRLKRLCHRHGSSPRFVLLSATVENPREFGESLIGEKVVVIDKSGAPKSGQHFLFLNPVASANFSAARLFSQCIRAGFRTIAFTQARKTTELIHIWASQLSPRYRDKISSYRAGFMPEERRDIEKRLAEGRLLGVISTSALEMGIDIGGLDICLLVGYPGTIINTWQRGGRVGRSGRDSLVILIAKPDALDQYFMTHPEELFQRSYEAAVLDPDNPYVLDAHLPCAASELPLTLDDGTYWPTDFEDHLEKLELEGKLARSADGAPTWFSPRKRPHLHVNLRSIGESFTIFEKETGQAIGTVDGMRAFKECHPGAVYLHRARHYLVDHLHLDKKDVIVHKQELHYFTRAHSDKETEIIEVLRSKPAAQFIVREGRLKVTEQVTGYEKRALPGQELMGTFSLDLPSQTFESMGLWIEIEPTIQIYVERKGLHFMGGIHAIEHGTIGIFPLFALCDRNDIGGICYPYHPQVEKGAIFIYDGYPGGVGLAQRGYTLIEALLEKTLSHISSCSCDEGCPSCIHSPKCGSGNKPLDKGAAILILQCLLGHIPISEITPESEEQDPPPLPDASEEEEGEKQGPRIVSFDLETQKSARDVGGWNNCHLMRVSVAVIYDSLEGQFFTFEEDAVGDLIKHLEKADLVVGFNIKRFDYAVLSAYTPKDFKTLPTFDILEDVHKRLGFRLGLDSLASETLGAGKSADGLQALEWFRQGEMEKITEYCKQDVAVTRDLFEFGLKEGYLIYRSKKEKQRLRLRVDWELEDMIKRD